ncbi:hypothetical protein D3C76_924600 [compost metagenome]
MVTDKLTLSLLSRLADAQLALATSMKGVTPISQGYPDEDLQRISEALEQIEASIAQIKASIDFGNSQGKLH